MRLNLGKGNALFTSETTSYVVVEIVFFCCTEISAAWQMT